MLTYLSRLAPTLSEVTAPLRQLLKENNEFVWDANHDTVFQLVKDLLTQEPGSVLTYFDHTKDVKLQVDTSKCIYGCDRFHQYLYGRKVIVESDKLESIMRKPLAASPPRLQRMILQL